MVTKVRQIYLVLMVLQAQQEFKELCQTGCRALQWFFSCTNFGVLYVGFNYYSPCDKDIQCTWKFFGQFNNYFANCIILRVWFNFQLPNAIEYLDDKLGFKYIHNCCGCMIYSTSQTSSISAINSTLAHISYSSGLTT